MRLLWLCHMVPGAIREAMGANPGSGLWMDHVLDDLRTQPDITLQVLSLGRESAAGRVDDRLGYAVFSNPCSDRPAPELEPFFAEQIANFHPDVIHIWGTEYPHTLAMLHVCRENGLLDRTAVSIQGLCSEYAVSYTRGLPETVVRGYTFRDFLRQDNVQKQQAKFARRGENELAALKIARHVIGRTPWDFACTERANPERVYHFCNETLRLPFYDGQWRYDSCRKHRIFASSCVYPIKGFHFLLLAMGQAAAQYPDLSLAVPGKDFLHLSIRDKIREDRYHRYLAELARSLHLEDKIQFLGKCSAEQMKQAYLEANVFVLPSVMENSPNSLGEAMLLGVPCVAADVGGVSTLMEQGKEGEIVSPGDVSELADAICRVFAMESAAEQMGECAHCHAQQTHNPETNLQTLLAIYRELSGNEGK